MNTTDIKEVVKEKYGQAALRVTAGGSSCCGATASSGCCDPVLVGYFRRDSTVRRSAVHRGTDRGRLMCEVFLPLAGPELGDIYGPGSCASFLSRFTVRRF